MSELNSLSPSPAPLPEQPSAARLALFTTPIVLMTFLTLGASIQMLNPAFGLWWSEVFIFFGISWIALRTSGRNPAVFTGLNRVSPKAIASGFALGLLNIFAVVMPLQLILLPLFPESWLEQFDLSRIFERNEGLEKYLLLSSVAIAAPVCEEMFFRGTLLGGLAKGRARTWGALLVTSVIFSAFHLDPVGFVGRVELGVLFGWLFLRTGSIWPGVAAHAANNGVAAVMLLLAKDMEDTKPDSTQLLAALGMAGVGLLIFIPVLRHIAGSHALREGLSADQVDLDRKPSWARAASGWFAVAVLAVGGLWLFDARGVRLSVFDVTHPLPDKLGDEQEKALMDLRKRARKNEAPLEEYQALRKSYQTHKAR